MTMPRDHTVKVGNDWVDGMLVGRAAAISEWRMRKEIDDPAFKRLIWRLYARNRWARLDPNLKAKARAYRDRWRRENKERYQAAVNRARRRGRKNGAVWWKREKARKRKRFAAEQTAKFRREVHTCVVCGAQWCIAFGRIPSRRPKYCSQPCRARANYLRMRKKGTR